MISRSAFDTRRLILTGASLAALTLASAAHAEPSGGSVTAGSASIAGDGTGRVTVTQTSDRAILDWNSFSIGKGESTQFIQPGSTSVVVNRVTGADPSSILGSLSANGRVVLINRNGIAFGKDATVDVGGLVATTADIDRQAFLATGSLNFSGGSLPDATIVNEGRITVRDAGLAALVAPSVRNSGTIVANLGRIALGAGTGFTVDFYGDGLVQFAPDGFVAATIGDGGTALVENSGLIEASGGKVVLSAAAARDVVNASVNVTGVVRADAVAREGGSIVLSGSGSVSVNGRVNADSEKQSGGTIAISGDSVSLGGLISASGKDGGSVGVEAKGLLSLAESVAATGQLGDGGSIRYAAGRIIETTTSRNDASGMLNGGTIRAVTEGGLATSGRYAADGIYGRGGHIDLSGAGVSLLSTGITARGRMAGGLVRIGGAFQGGKTPDTGKAYHSTFLGRWGAREALPNADTIFVGNAASIDVSSARGDGGTAVFWSDTRTTFLGSVDARGGRGGSIEISSAGDLRQAALDRVFTGAGGHLLLDPKNIVIGTVDDVESWQYAAILGTVYANDSNPETFQNSAAAALDVFDMFGTAVALNAAGTRMVVGASGDDGAGNSPLNMGAVYMFSFADGDFSNGTLTGIIGKGYTGGKNIDVTELSGADNFGVSVALNAAGDLLAVGAIGDDGADDSAISSGAVHLFRFADGNFTSGAHVGMIGHGYTDNGDVALSIEMEDNIGRSISLNADGTLLAIGAWADDGFGNTEANTGAVHLVSFSDTQFGGGTSRGTIGHGYSGLGDVNLALDGDDFLGISVSLNAAGDRLAIGAYGDDGFANSVTNSGAVHVIGFSGANFSGGGYLGTIGSGYSGAGDTNLNSLTAGDAFGYAITMNADGTRFAGTALSDDGATGMVPMAGGVHLLSFTNTNLSGGTLEAIIGTGYVGGKNIDIPDLEAGDLFGFSLAFNAAGDRLAVGAYGDDGGDNATSDAGAVHLISFSDGDFSNGALRGIIGRDSWRTHDIDLPVESGDNIGVSIALNNAGDRMALGAWGDSGFNNITSAAGAVYLLSFSDSSFSGGTLTGIIGKGYTGGNNIDVPDLQANDWFGTGVALNAAGDRLAVGALGVDSDMANTGAVYLFTFSDTDFSDGTLVNSIGRGRGFDIPTLDTSEQFGVSVALNNAGDRLAVGAIGDRGANNEIMPLGAVYLISFSDDSFGGGTVTGTIGAGYQGAKDIDLQTLELGDQFGVSVAFNGAGDRLAVGAMTEGGSGNATPYSGAVYLFSFSDGNFSGGVHTGTVGNGYVGGSNVDIAALESTDQLGRSVALNDAGDRLAIGSFGDAGSTNGAHAAGAVYLVSFSDGNFSNGTLTATLGKGYAGGKNMDVALAGGDQFGTAIAMNGAGDRLAVGAPGDAGASGRLTASGAVYLFRFEDTNFYAGRLLGIAGAGYRQTESISLNAGPDSSAEFGISTALNGIGDRLAVGALGDKGAGSALMNGGAVYLFSFSDDQFSDGALEAIIGKGYTGGKNIDVGAIEDGDGFGISVALNDAGDRIVVGASGDDGFANGAFDSGAAYLFTFTDDHFSGGRHSGTIGAGYIAEGDVTVTLGTGDAFGSAVALNAAGNRMAIGAYLDDGSGNIAIDSGAAYLFSFSDTDFGSGTLAGTIGRGYAAAGGMPTLESGDQFGISLALNGAGDMLAIGASGDDGAANDVASAGAVHLLTFANTDFGGGSHAGTIGKGYSGGNSLNLAMLEVNDQFGRSVALDGIGDDLAVGAHLDDGSGNTVENAGALHVFGFSDALFSGGTLKATIGAGYTGASDTNLALDAGDNFGASAALNANGFRLAVGAAGDDGASDAIANSGAVYLFSTERSSAFGYADRPDATINIAATSLAALLASGTNLTLQASNDITIAAAITVDNTSGDGGDLTLQAGRSVLVNANIVTDNGNLTIIGNDTLANGVIDAYRDNGIAAITMASGTTIDARTGDVSIVMRDGAGKTYSGIGSITLRTITAGTLDVTNLGDIVLNGNVTTSGAQTYSSALSNISVNSGANLLVTGKATLGLTAGAQISISGATLTNSYDDDDDAFDAIVVRANDDATPFSVGGTNQGLAVQGGSVIRTANGGAGNIALFGRAGDGSTNGIGIQINHGIIESLGAGTLTIEGYGGGAATGNIKYGVLIQDAPSGANGGSRIESNLGDISITGTGGAFTTGVNNMGVAIIQNSQILSTGIDANAAKITITGTGGGTGTSYGNTGVNISDAATRIESLDGDISITGTGSANAEGTTNGNVGIVLAGGAVVESTGTGATAATISLAGTGGGKGTSGGNSGILITGTGTAILADTGDISVSGTGGSNAEGTHNHGIALSSAAHVVSSGTAEIAFVGQGGGKDGSASATNIGIYLSSPGTSIEGNLGDISLTGTGGSGSSTVDAHHYGVQIGTDTQVRSIGTGSDAADIFVSGTGGSGGGNKRIGVYLNAVQALLSDAGDINVKARGGASASGTANDGLYVSGVGPKIASSSGEIVIDAAKGGGTGKDFNNLTGNTAVQSTSGRWIIYLDHPDNNTFNNLASGNLPTWGKTATTLPPASVGAGNRYVFAHQPTLTVSSSFSDTKVYGDTYSFAAPVRGTHYNVTGLVNASTYQSVWTQETLSNIGLSGAPVFTSAGAAFGANVAGSPYAVSLSNGTLETTAGYQFGTPSSTGTLTVTPKAITIAGVTAGDKVYDGDDEAVLGGGTLDGVVGSDDVGFSAGSGSFANRNVGTWAVTVGGYTLTGSDAGNYTLTQPTVTNAAITAKSLTLTGVLAANKTYDGSTDAALSGGALDGIIVGDNVEFTAGSGQFASRNAGAWSITVSGYTLGGDDAGNYTLVQPTVADATITPRTLNTGVTANGKTYDGTRDAALSFTTSDMVSGDTLAFDYDARFADKTVGANKAISLTGSVTLTGADAANYTLALDAGDVSDLSATITARTLTVSNVEALAKTYDGTRDASLAFTSDAITGDDIGFLYEALFADRNAGTSKTVAVTNGTITLQGADAGNYSFLIDAALLEGLSSDIGRKSLLVTDIVTAGKTYDGTRNVLLDLTSDGLVAGDTIGFDYEALASDRNAGTAKAVTVSGVTLSGTNAANYDLLLDDGLLGGLTADVAAKSLTVVADDQSRAQFGHNPAFTYHLVGLAEGDDASVVSGVSLFTAATDTSPAGAYAIEASGGAAGNYVLSYTAGTLTVTGHLIAPYDQQLLQHGPESLSGSDGFGRPAPIAAMPTLHTLAGYAEDTASTGQQPFCTRSGNPRGARRLAPHLQLNMGGRALYCLGSPSRFAQ